jgi:cytochrome o ubiquinol oxidase subunit 2
MKFRALALSNDQFAQWVQKVKAVPAHLGAAEYQRLSAPSEANPVTYFSQIDNGLFHSIMTEHDGKAMKISSVMSGTEH